MADLRLGNLANKMSPSVSGGVSQEDIARSQGLQNVFASMASGIDTSKQNSPIMNILGQGLSGAAAGYGYKAGVQTGKAQDEYNQYVQQMAEYEKGLAEAENFEKKQEAAESKIVVPATVARIEYSKTGDKQAYEAKVRSLADSFAQGIGAELVTAHLDPQNDQRLVMSLKGPTGAQDTQIIDISDMIAKASKLDPELAKQGMMSIGVTPPMEKGSLQEKISQTEKGLGRPLTDQEKSELAGFKATKEATTDQGNFMLGEKGAEAQQKQRATVIENLPKYQDAVVSADMISEKLASGVKTGILSSWSAPAQQLINEAVGTQIFNNPKDLAEIKSQLNAQLGTVIKQFGSGTAISDRDLSTAREIVGSAATPSEALIRIQALVKAKAQQAVMEANIYNDPVAMGYNTKSEAEAAIRDMYDPKNGTLKQLYNDNLRAYATPMVNSQAKELGMSAPAQGQQGGMVKISNGSETFMVSPEDAQAAAADGFKVVQ